MIIKRDLYLNRLIDSMDNGMIKVVTGLRRSGKSFLLFNLFYQYLLNEGVDDEHIIKFAFDSQDYLSLIHEDILDIDIRKRKVNPKKFMDYINRKVTDNKKYYLLLDEIQYLDSFEAVLNGYLRAILKSPSKLNPESYVSQSPIIST